jgi:hypothetical protein
MPTTSEEDDLAGVSALMKALPDKTAARKKRKSSTAKSKSTSRRKPKSKPKAKTK